MKRITQGNIYTLCIFFIFYQTVTHHNLHIMYLSKEIELACLAWRTSFNYIFKFYSYI